MSSKEKEKEKSNHSKILFAFSLWAYSTNVLIHLYCCFYHIIKYRIITKVFLMPLLLLLYYQITTKETRTKCLVYSLIFGALGDIIILNKSMHICIILGLACFLIGHLLYISEIASHIEMKLWKEKMWTALGLLIFFGCLVSYLFKYHLGEGMARGKVVIPGILYMSILGLLNSAAIFYLLIKKTKSSILVCVGAFLFSSSDFILTKQMFYGDNPYYSFLIMSTYIMAQTFLTVGLSNDEKKQYIIRKLLEV